MEDNLKLILEEFEQLKGQIVITMSYNIERLVAVGDDETDYYWITFDGRKFKWNTCVGRIIPLKGHLPDKDYDHFVRRAKLNDYDQIPLFGKLETDEVIDKVNAFKRDLVVLPNNHKFLTDVCWQIN